MLIARSDTQQVKDETHLLPSRTRAIEIYGLSPQTLWLLFSVRQAELSGPVLSSMNFGSRARGSRTLDSIGDQ